MLPPWSFHFLVALVDLVVVPEALVVLVVVNQIWDLV